MAVTALYALQNGYLGFERSGLFFGERSAERVPIPIACYLVKTTDGTVLFDTGVSPRAVPGLLRNDAMARFEDADLLVHRLDSIGARARRRRPGRAVAPALRPRGRRRAVPHVGTRRAEKDEYATALYPPAFFAGFYYRRTSTSRATAGGTSTATPSSPPA